MAVVVDERLEGTGYEETWSNGETLGGGATLNEDLTPPAFAPDNWAEQCAQWVYVAANGCYVLDINVLLPDINIAYLRAEFIIDAESFANNQFNAICVNVGGNGTDSHVYVYVGQDGNGDLRFAYQEFADGTAGGVVAAGPVLALDTPYVWETLWDVNGQCTVWLDGEVLFNETITDVGVTASDSLLWGGSDGLVAADATVLQDNLIGDDATRVGLGRFFSGLQSMGGGVGTRIMNPAHSLGGRLNGALQE